MANLSLAVLIIIFVVCVIIALAVGYLVGSRSGGGVRKQVEQEKQKHDAFRSDVRKHFQETSAIMSRMVHDYREMYEHMSEGAERLAELSREKMVTPPPAPESITRGNSHDDEKNASAVREASAPPSQPSLNFHADSEARGASALRTGDESAAPQSAAEDSSAAARSSEKKSPEKKTSTSGKSDSKKTAAHGAGAEKPPAAASDSTADTASKQTTAGNAASDAKTGTSSKAATDDRASSEKKADTDTSSNTANKLDEAQKPDAKQPSSGQSGAHKQANKTKNSAKQP